MTAVTPLVRIPTPNDIATHPVYTCGTWRDAATGLNLPEFLATTVGRFEARRILAAADAIRTGRSPAVAPKRQPAPQPGHDRVWSFDGVDHDPIPMHQVTVCGQLIPPPFVYEPASADAKPCPDCFEGVPR